MWWCGNCFFFSKGFGIVIGFGIVVWGWFVGEIFFFCLRIFFLKYKVLNKYFMLYWFKVFGIMWVIFGILVLLVNGWKMLF